MKHLHPSVCRTYNLGIGRANPHEAAKVARGRRSKVGSNDQAAATAATTIRLCGDLSVAIRGRLVTAALGGRQGRAVLACLVLNRRAGVTRDQLIDVLWPSTPPKSPDRGLDVVMSRLRAALGPGVVEGRTHLDLRLDADAWVDVEIAEERAREAEDAIVRDDPERARAAAHAGLAIVAGSLLPDLEGPWLDPHRARFGELEPRLLRAAIRAGLDLGGSEIAEAEAEARRLLDHNRFSESAWALLMEAQAGRGDVAEALQTYEQLRVLLRDELGSAPSKAVTKLHTQLLRSDAATVEPTASGPPPPAAVDAPLPTFGGEPEERFVGRATELAALREKWASSASEQWPFLLLEGEAGIGKTTLAARFAEEVGPRSVLFGRCDEEPIVPYQPFVEAFHHPDAFVGWAPGEETYALAPLMPGLQSTAEEHGQQPAVPPELQRYVMFEAVARRLCAWTRIRPLLLVLDDLHWADKPTVKLLQHIARDRRSTRLMVLATYRGEEALQGSPLTDLLEGLRKDRRLELYRLKGLSRGETDTLVTDRIQARLPNVVDELWARTDGNPLFIEEALRSLNQSIASPDGGEVSARTLDRMGVPEGVKEVIRRRLGTLSPEAVDALRAAAAIGRVFDPRQVAELLRIDVDEVLDALEGAPTRGLVVESAKYRFAFRHAIVRMAIYEELSESRRARLHQRIGAVLERGPARPGRAAEVAHHFLLAGELADPMRMVEHEEQAGDEAARAFAYEEAGEHFERAAAALTPLGPAHEARRCRILLAWGRVLSRAGMSEEASSRFHQAAESARRRGDAKQLADAALGLGQRYWEANVSDSDRRYRMSLEEALDALPEADSGLRARLLSRLAENLAFLPRERERAGLLSAEALSMARRVGDADTLIAALMARHVTRLHIEHVDERLALIDEVLRLRGRHRELSAEACQWRLYDLCELGRLDHARADFGRLRRLSSELRQPLLRHVAVAWEGVFTELSGNVIETERLAEESYHLGRQAQAYDARSIRAAKLFSLYRWQGRLGELKEDIEALGTGPNALGAWRAALALHQVLTGSRDEGRASAHALAAHLGAIPRDFFWLSAVAVLAECAALCEDEAAARPLYEALRPYASRNTQHSFAACWGSVERPLGLLAATLGRTDAAEAHFRAALDANQAIGAPVLVAVTECDYAELLAQRGDRRLATELGAAAEERAGALGLAGARRTGGPASRLTGVWDPRPPPVSAGRPGRQDNRCRHRIQPREQGAHLAQDLLCLTSDSGRLRAAARIGERPLGAAALAGRGS